MTAEETIELLRGMQNKKEDYAEMVCAPAWACGYEYVYPEPEDYAIEEAIEAIKEVQQYREIGTVEQCREAMEKQRLREEVFANEGSENMVKGELIVDNFAGGGGASTGIEMATGYSVDIAINHDPEAIRMHKTNHPNTKHYCESVWNVDPVEVCDGRPVALAWFSPDCKHFSKAKG